MSQPRSTKLWFDVRQVPARSNGTAPVKDVFACPSNFQIYDAKDEQEAADLVVELNAAALRVIGS